MVLIIQFDPRIFFQSQRQIQRMTKKPSSNSPRKTEKKQILKLHAPMDEGLKREIYVEKRRGLTPGKNV